MRQRIVLASEFINHDLECLRRLLLNQSLRNQPTRRLHLRISTIHTVARKCALIRIGIIRLAPRLQIQIIVARRAKLHGTLLTMKFYLQFS